jgi:branched-chain amino acid transport system ATP-binding protein
MVDQQLILLDEPFEGIAPALAQRLVEVLHTIKRQGGPSIPLSDSDYTHSAGLIDRLCVIERGAVIERAS